MNFPVIITSLGFTTHEFTEVYKYCLKLKKARKQQANLISSWPQ